MAYEHRVLEAEALALTICDFDRRPGLEPCETILLLDGHPASPDVPYDVHACLLDLNAYVGGGRKQGSFGVCWVRTKEDRIDDGLIETGKWVSKR